MLRYVPLGEQEQIFLRGHGNGILPEAERLYIFRGGTAKRPWMHGQTSMQKLALQSPPAAQDTRSRKVAWSFPELKMGLRHAVHRRLCRQPRIRWVLGFDEAVNSFAVHVIRRLPVPGTAVDTK